MANQQLPLFCQQRDLFEHLFLQRVVALKTLNPGVTHPTQLITFANGSRWVTKTVSQENWLGVRRKDDIEVAEQLGRLVEKKMHITYAARSWGQQRRLLTVDKRWMLFIPYCKGETLEYCSRQQAFRLGGLLAALHQLLLPKDQAKPLPMVKLPVACELPSFCFEQMNRCNDNYWYQAEHWVTSHRDMHLANIIWRTNKTPYLIDWESSGLIHPFVELIGLALNCAGLAKGRFNSGHFSASLAGYQAVAGYLPAESPILWQLCYQSWLLWLSYIVKAGQNAELHHTLQAIALLRKRMLSLQAAYHVVSRR